SVSRSTSLLPHPMALTIAVLPAPAFLPYTTLFRSACAADVGPVRQDDRVKDAQLAGVRGVMRIVADGAGDHLIVSPPLFLRDTRDRKSTRLNSSHVKISYAVFCLKKKNNVVLGEYN